MIRSQISAGISGHVGGREQTAQQRVLLKAARPITLRDLLTHTSGLGEYRVTDPHWTLAAMIKVLAREPLRFSTRHALELFDSGIGPRSGGSWKW